MARNKKQSVAEDLIEITAIMPWWVGVALALIGYLVLHAVAQKPLAALTQPGQVGSLAVSALWKNLAGVGQYLLPLLFLLGAGMSAFKRYQAAQLHDAAANRVDGVANMTWREFEALIGEYFHRQGFTVLEQGGAGPDGGVDVLLKKGSDSYLVQCKHWRALRVGVQPVRELYGVMAAKRVAGGFMVTSGDFTDEARSFAQGRELQLINGKALQSSIRAQATSVPRAVASAPAPSASSAPDCPICNAPMVLRQARSGGTPGKKFWGCSKFTETKCRGTREVA